MSLVIRRVASWCCWSAASAVGFSAGRSLTDTGSAAWLLAAAALLALAGVFLHPVMSLRVALLPFTALLAAVGMGAGATVAVVVALCGAVAIELLHSRLRGASELRARLAVEGVITAGTVVSAQRYFVGAMPMTRVAVHYVDTDGREWQARTNADGVVSEGARVRLRYLPQSPTTVEVLRS